MINVSEQIGSVDRSVTSGSRADTPTRIVTISQTYETDAADLWDACTNPERIPRWFLPVSGDLRLGGRYQLEGNAGGVIEECEPPHRFSATWEIRGTVNWIDVRFIVETPGRTRLQLAHIAPADDATWAQFGPGAVGIGWDMALIGLVLHLASGGAPVDRAAAMAWTTSADGRDFVVRSSERWRDASVAGGTPEAEADAAATEVTAAYGAAPER